MFFTLLFFVPNGMCKMRMASANKCSLKKSSSTCLHLAKLTEDPYKQKRALLCRLYALVARGVDKITHAAKQIKLRECTIYTSTKKESFCQKQLQNNSDNRHCVVWLQVSSSHQIRSQIAHCYRSAFKGYENSLSASSSFVVEQKLAVCMSQ